MRDRWMGWWERSPMAAVLELGVGETQDTVAHLL